MVPSACRLCGGSRLTRLFSARDRLLDGPGTFAIVRCGDCGGRLTMPAPERLEAYYPAESYGPHQEAAPPREPGAWSSDSYWLPPLPRGARVVELGCGRGDFLRLARARGWEAEGVETAPAAAERARGTGAVVHGRPVEELRLPAGSRDAVFAWMMLEHVRRPADTMAEVARILRPGGLFVFSVPDAGSWEFSWFREDWYALDCPRHLSHFDRRVLRGLLARSGLAPLAWRWQRNAAYALHSMGLRLGARGLVEMPDGARRIWTAALYPLACVLAALRQGGKLTVVARRPR